MTRLYDVYAVKLGSKYEHLAYGGEKFIITDFASPISNYVGEEHKELLCITKHFYPDRYEYFSISVYAIPASDFEDNFERIGTFNDYIKPE